MVSSWIGSPPVVFSQLQEALKDTNVSFKKFDAIIKADSDLTTRLLRVANSSFYALDTKVETISHALRVIGVKPLIEMALSMVMVQKFKGILPGTLDNQSFWKHNIACGLASRAIAQNLGRDNLETFYMAGMLHDIGFLIISQENPKKAQEIIAKCKFDEIPQNQVEKEMLGFSHARVGAVIFKEWGLAPSLIEAVRYHHCPTQAKKFPVETAVLHVADYLVDNMKYTLGDYYIITALDPAVLQITGVTGDTLDYIRQVVSTQIDETLEIFTK
jgi:putative nucleotidyltransferase with HDIG domain